MRATGPLYLRAMSASARTQLLDEGKLQMPLQAPRSHKRARHSLRHSKHIGYHSGFMLSRRNRDPGQSVPVEPGGVVNHWPLSARKKWLPHQQNHRSRAPSDVAAASSTSIHFQTRDEMHKLQDEFPVVGIFLILSFPAKIIPRYWNSLAQIVRSYFTNRMGFTSFHG